MFFIYILYFPVFFFFFFNDTATTEIYTLSLHDALPILTPGASPGMAQELAQVVGSVLAAERDAVQVAAELSERYEEIDLIYTISEILGHTIRLDEAADRILREVSTVVGARRATLLVHDA